MVNGLECARNPYNKENNIYVEDDELCELWQLQAARLCREDEIPEEFKLKTYEIY